jgi:hypothetical protein
LSTEKQQALSRRKHIWKEKITSERRGKKRFMMLLMPESGEEMIMMLLPELAGCWSPVELFL